MDLTQQDDMKKKIQREKVFLEPQELHSLRGFVTPFYNLALSHLGKKPQIFLHFLVTSLYLQKFHIHSIIIRSKQTNTFLIS